MANGINFNLLKQVKELSEANTFEQSSLLSEQKDQLNILQKVQQKYFYKETIPMEDIICKIDEDEVFDSKNPDTEDVVINNSVISNIIEETVVGSSKTFDEMIEEKLKEEQKGKEQKHKIIPKKQKLPYLKKGEGLKRFEGKKNPTMKIKALPPKSDYSTCSSSNFTESKNEISSINDIDNKNEMKKDLKEFEAMEDILDNMSFVSLTPSIASKIQQMTKERIQNEKPLNYKNNFENYNSYNYTDNDKTHISVNKEETFDDDHSWGSLSDPDTTVVEKKEIKRHKSPTALVKRFFPQINDDEKYTKSRNDKLDSKETNTAKLTEKVALLENEQLKFNKTNEELQIIKHNKQHELNRLKREIAMFEKERDTELTRLKDYKDIEMNKIKKERRQFDLWIKSQRDNPIRIERQKIEELEHQMEENQNISKMKEKRWNSSLIRLKDRIDFLEKQNDELKQEIKICERFRYEKCKEISSEEIVETKSKTNDKLNTNIDQESKDGTKEIKFSNGTKKIVKADGISYAIHYFNGDEKYKFKDKQVVYYYAETGSVQITFPNGVETILFTNGQIERKFKDGGTDILFPDRSSKFIYKDGKQTMIQNDDTFIRDCPGGTRIIHFPSGQTEINCDNIKRRIYPDGTLKIINPDGTHENIYADGHKKVKTKKSTDTCDKMNL